MSVKLRVLYVRLAIFAATCFGVFVLPFLLPPPYFQGVSASNLAGFNNRVAAMAAAGMGVVVFLLLLKWPFLAGQSVDGPATGEDLPDAEQGRLSRPLVVGVLLMWGAVVVLFGVQIIRLGVTFPGDWGYFIDRVSMHADFGRALYSQIEFPYGPLLFYGPIWIRSALSPLHVSAAAAYLVTLTLETVSGILMVAYVIDNLPMSRRWKGVIFLLGALGMVPANMGLNYTFFRFATPLAFLVMASRRRRLWAQVLWMVVGQAVCLGVSPEIGFAFFWSSFAYGVYQCFTKGWRWAAVAAASVLSVAGFLLIVGRPYLRMVRLFAHGVMSLPIEPLPHICLVLFGLVWLVPACLACLFRQRRPEAPMLAALFVASLGLLPAAFGRADPPHVFWNELSIFLLSAMAISVKRTWQQIAWGASVTLVFLWMGIANLLVERGEIGPVVHSTIAELKGRRAPVPGTDFAFSMRNLQAIVGDGSVVVPNQVPAQVEAALREAGQRAPAFYYYQVGILNADAENRELQEFNQAKWALIPRDSHYRYFELPGNLLGFGIGYPTRRPVYVIGIRFAQNLEENWRVRGSVGKYLVYERLSGSGAGHAASTVE